MKLGKLAKTLRRDLGANPVKGAVLGVLILAAGYFWGPLVWRWTRGRSQQESVVAASAVAVIPATTPSIQGTSNAVAPGLISQVNWSQIRLDRNRNPLASSTTFSSAWLDPFRADPVASTPVETEVKPEESATQADGVDPLADLVLESVVIGPRKRVAIISGKIYREQGRLTLGDQEAGTTDRSFTLVRVERKSVTLQRDGKNYRLELAATKLAEAEQIGPALPSAHPETIQHP